MLFFNYKMHQNALARSTREAYRAPLAELKGRNMEGVDQREWKGMGWESRGKAGEV